MMQLPSVENLQCFLAAAETLHFRNAAARASLTPTAFGQRIRQLEEQLGVALFLRTTREVSLTEAGLALLPEARRVVQAAQTCLETAKGTHTPAPMDLVLGTRQELGLSWILPQVETLTRARPWLQLHLYFGSGPDLVARVRAHQIDIAVTSTRFSDPKLDALLLHREDYVFVGAPQLLRTFPIRSMDVKLPFALLDAAPELPLFRYWKEAKRGTDKLRFSRITSLGSIAAIRHRILECAGVGVLPRYLVAEDLRKRRLLTILPKIVPMHDHFRLVFRKDDPRRSVFVSLAEEMRKAPLR